MIIISIFISIFILILLLIIIIFLIMFKEAEGELGGSDSCSQPVTFYISRAQKFYATHIFQIIIVIIIIIMRMMMLVLVDNTITFVFKIPYKTYISRR